MVVASAVVVQVALWPLPFEVCSQVSMVSAVLSTLSKPVGSLFCSVFAELFYYTSFYKGRSRLVNEVVMVP